MKQMESTLVQPIPESAEDVFSRNEMYRKYLQNLDVIVSLYNKVKAGLLDVEMPLVEGQLKSIDSQLDRAMTELNWTNEGTVSIRVVQRTRYKSFVLIKEFHVVLKELFFSLICIVPRTNHYCCYLRCVGLCGGHSRSVNRYS